MSCRRQSFFRAGVTPKLSLRQRQCLQSPTPGMRSRLMDFTLPNLQELSPTMPTRVRSRRTDSTKQRTLSTNARRHAKRLRWIASGCSETFARWTGISSWCCKQHNSDNERRRSPTIGNSKNETVAQYRGITVIRAATYKKAATHLQVCRSNKYLNHTLIIMFVDKRRRNGYPPPDGASLLLLGYP